MAPRPIWPSRLYSATTCSSQNEDSREAEAIALEEQTQELLSPEGAMSPTSLVISPAQTQNRRGLLARLSSEGC